MNTFQQWLLWMHIMGGSAIFVSIFMIHVRKKAFENRFGAALKEQQQQRRKRRATFWDTSGQSFSMHKDLSFPPASSQVNGTNGITEKPDLNQPQNSNGSARDRPRSDTSRSGGQAGDMETAVESPTANSTSGSTHTSQGEAKDPNNIEPTKINSNQSITDHIAFVPGTSFNPTSTMAQTSRIKRRNSTFSFTGVGASPVTAPFHRPFFSELNDSPPSRPSAGLGLTHDAAAPSHIGDLLRKEVIGRNSEFHGLTHQEREQIGGVEYSAIQLLSWVVPIYFVLWQLLGCLAVGAWMNNYASDITGANGINAWWVFLPTTTPLFQALLSNS
jgi:Cation transport protein